MARVLLAWELGGGYGHVAKLLPLSRRLRAAGHDVALLLREPHRAAGAEEGVPVAMAPHWKGRNPPGASAINYAGVLALSGYASAENVRGLVAAWRRIYASTQPHLLVANHAPTALLAARGAGFPAMALGTGFEMPPPSRPSASLQPWRKVTKADREKLDAKVLAIANAGARGGKAAPLASISDIVDADIRFLCTFPEIDHYPDRGTARYVGPIAGAVGKNAPVWPDGGSRRAFVYLTGKTVAQTRLVEHLRRLGWSVAMHLRDAPPQLLEQAAAAGIRVEPRPVDLPALAGQCDLIVSHGGHGTTAQALLAGIPILTFPQHLEQATLAHRVAAVGAGKAVAVQAEGIDYGAVMAQLVEAGAARAAAERFAAKHRDFDAEVALDQIAARCMALLD